MASKKQKKLAKKQQKKAQRRIEISENLLGIEKYKPVNNWLVYLTITLFTFAIYGNAIFNDFTLDDGIVITKNKFTKNGFAGIKDIFSYDTMAGEHGKDVDFVAGGRYRPFSVATFAVEYQLFGENVKIFHFNNILLYAITGILIYLIFMRLLISPLYRPIVPKWYFSIPFIAAILFVGHPVHTEIVANIKGRDEIIAMLGALAAFLFALKYIDTKKVIFLLLVFLSFFVGLLSKENAVTFLAVIPIGLYLFKNAEAKDNFKTFIPLFIATLLFVLIRWKTIGFTSAGTPHELMNNSFVDASDSERWGTVFYTFYRYLKLLFFPYSLTWDYYPYHIPLVSAHDLRSILPLMIYVALGIFALIGLVKKKYKIFTFSVIIYFATLSPVSNIFFSLGVFMSERFMYFPSYGFVLLAAYFLVRILPEYLYTKKSYPVEKLQTIIGSAIFIILLLYGIRTITRNEAWEDNFTLFTNDVKTSTESAKGNTTAGEQLVTKGMELDDKDPVQAAAYYELSIEYLEKAIRIHPKYVAARLDLGIAYQYHKKDYGKAIDMYISTIKLKPNYEKAYTNISIIFYRLDSAEFRLNVYERLYQLNSNRADVNYILGSLYGAVKKDIKRSIHFLTRAIQLNPKMSEAYTDLGVAYGFKRDYHKAIQMLEKSYSMNKNSLLTLRNLVTSYKSIGNIEKEQYYRKLAISTRNRLIEQQKKAKNQKNK
jgi:Flp pilus assembly protein TadD